MLRFTRIALLFAVVWLAGCDMLGIESADGIAAARTAAGQAIGAACRHAGRAIEDCYTLYRKSDRASIYAGWRDMNDYMREYKIEPVAPHLSAQPAPTRSAASPLDEGNAGAKAAADGVAQAQAAAARPRQGNANDS